MKRWLSIEFNDLQASASFGLQLNKCSINSSDRVYFKVFTPKGKENKHKIFYIADEGSAAIKCLEKYFVLKNCVPPERNLLTRVGGASADREWMF
ncbi:MAG TPA: hypothetical protein VK498_11105 [Ferruginibacter sp.]|nr:hypothetical protein [Ferruginibacter sp.]